MMYCLMERMMGFLRASRSLLHSEAAGTINNTLVRITVEAKISEWMSARSSTLQSAVTSPLQRR